MNVAIVLAAGTGKRFDENNPKQFFKINEKEVVRYSVEIFSSFSEIQKIIVVTCKDYLSFTQKLFKSDPKVEVIAGGAERSESSRNAITHLKNTETKNVLIHDAARPFVSKEIIQNCLDALQKNKAVVVAVPSTQTVSIVEDGKIVSIPDRKTIYIHQTPQCFDYNLIYNAFQSTKEIFTDDVSVVFQKTDIKIVFGDEKNIKITTKMDV